MEQSFIIVGLTLAIVTVWIINRGVKPFDNQYSRLSKNDGKLITVSVSIEGLNEEQKHYIYSIGNRMMSHNIGYINNITLHKFLLIAVLTSNYVAVGITGSGLVECNIAKSESFVINLIAALLAGTSAALRFEKTAEDNREMAANYRWEFEQFIGMSQEYFKTDLSTRYKTFCDQTDILIKTDLKNQQKGNVDAKKTAVETKKAAEDYQKLTSTPP